ncbi:PorT family protein [Fulvivirga maritima]|uniref:porin family protein n=1 Tax=Fulvivirga maritima TaxID=2904247 RepID=UPI001F1B6A3A|nr:porin family protein [Fulvivirga maritima]UII26709.1 PorT family protein [Fulvivirga maritima]
MSYNKWKFSITLLFVIISWSAIAQDQFISLKGGLNITKIQSDGLFSPNDARKGFIAGVGYEYHLGTGIFIGADLLYNQRGYTIDAYLMSDNGSNIKEKVTFEYDYNYISLPLKVGYKSGSTKISAFGNVGLVPSLLVYAEITEPSLGELLEGENYYYHQKGK